MRIELPNLAAVPCRQRPKRAPERERERERPQQLQQQIQQFARIDWLRGTVDSLPRGKAFYLFGFAIIRIPSRAILVFVASSPAVPLLEYEFSPPPPC